MSALVSFLLKLEQKTAKIQQAACKGDGFVTARLLSTTVLADGDDYGSPDPKVNFEWWTQVV